MFRQRRFRSLADHRRCAKPLLEGVLRHFYSISSPGRTLNSPPYPKPQNLCSERLVIWVDKNRASTCTNNGPSSSGSRPEDRKNPTRGPHRGEVNSPCKLSLIVWPCSNSASIRPHNSRATAFAAHRNVLFKAKLLPAHLFLSGPA
jgi:hypothetical protein